MISRIATTPAWISTKVTLIDSSGIMHLTCKARDPCSLVSYLHKWRMVQSVFIILEMVYKP